MKRKAVGYMLAKINFRKVVFQIGTANKNGTFFYRRRMCRKVPFLTICSALLRSQVSV